MRNRYVLLIDLPLIFLAACGAFLLRFDWFFATNRPEWVPFLVIALVLKPMIFMAFGLYGRYWMYATANDLVVVVMGVTAASGVLALLVGIGMTTHAIREFSRSVMLIDWLLTIVAIGGLRFGLRLLNDRHMVRIGSTVGAATEPSGGWCRRCRRRRAARDSTESWAELASCGAPGR